MISNRNVDNRHTAEYTLTELKNVEYPLDTGCNGTHQMNQILISCNEKNMLIEENKFETRPTPFGSKQFQIYQNEHLYQSIYETEMKKLHGVDHKIEKSSVIGQKRKQPDIDEPDYSMDCTSSPPLPARSDPCAMLKKLTKPIPSHIQVDNRKTVRDMKEWFGLQHCTIKFFCDTFLNINPNHLRNLFAQPREFHVLREAKQVFIKMYNWLEMSDDERAKMLKMDLKSERSSDFETILDENEPPKKVIRLDCPTPNQLFSSPITAEKVAEIMNKPATYVNTKKVSKDLKEWLRSTKTSREWFATTIMERAKRTLRDHLNNPKDWNDMVKGQEIFLRMHNWMAISEEERQAILRFYRMDGRGSVISMASPDESFRNL
ncbi:hypothetical protein GCK72_022536 [Caenorhabditis remanei]|uniref:CUT domain-containing protein n=1 Tax=Caenorhabditis remanei TaxID=31234 RepID=A0A6A5FU69_CAERE|nr:hypothetical protein GCK72_022536 [Caenorhabditis remanei]KAF1746084.1 hypothetical protein GCK72_022536 [Caenorhabditis remanei]